MNQAAIRQTKCQFLSDLAPVFSKIVKSLCMKIRREKAILYFTFSIDFQIHPTLTVPRSIQNIPSMSIAMVAETTPKMALTSFHIS